MDEVRESRKCWHCGKELTDRNSWMATDGFDPGVPSFYCVGCQSTYNVGLSKLVGPDMALFICCAMFNVPFIPEAVSAAKTYKAERGVWGAYIKVLRDAKYHRMSDKWYGFSDGETDIRKALGMEDLNITTPDDEKIAKAKQELLNKERWGTGPKSRRYKEDDYDELNGLYDAMTKDRVAMSDQSEISVRNICKWSLERDRCIEEKDFNAAQKLSSMIEKEKESEQLRKKDEMPQDLARLDDIVKAVERAGLHIMDYEELKKELATYIRLHQRRRRPDALADPQLHRMERGHPGGGPAGRGVRHHRPARRVCHGAGRRRTADLQRPPDSASAHGR